MKPLTAQEIESAIVAGGVEEMPRPERRPRLPKEVTGDPSSFLRLIVKGETRRDAIAKFEPQQLNKWGNPPKFHLFFVKDRPDEIIFEAVFDDRRGKGIFTITQKTRARLGTTTLTWRGLKRKPPVDKQINESLYIPIIFVGNYMVLNVSALERAEL
jgi:hypothetical protein